VVRNKLRRQRLATKSHDVFDSNQGDYSRKYRHINHFQEQSQFSHARKDKSR